MFVLKFLTNTSRFWRSVVVLTTLCMVACQPQEGTQGSSSVESKKAMDLDQQISEDAADLDGELPAPQASQTTKSASESMLTAESLKAESLKAESIVEDAGFSTLPSVDNLPIEPVASGKFCLGVEPEAVAEISPAMACDRIARRLASVSKSGCDNARLKPSQCESVNGFPILFREFEPLAERTPQGRILVIGGTHGDELTSVSIVFRWIEKLNKYHSGLFHWHVVPMMNPDGVLKRAAQRTNENGVDLNRNLPSDDWQENALSYWREKQDENPRRYPGEEPASEPETQWLVDVIDEFKPDAIISVHAPYGVVDFDALLLNTAPKSLGKLHLNLLGTYPGSLGNYAGINRNIPVITLELPHAWEMPSESETTKIWEDIVSWLRKNVNQEVADSK